MGQPMALRLLHAGYPVTVWNRTASKTLRCHNHGASIATTPAAAVEHADLVITMLENGPIVREVLSAALPGITHEAVVVDMSSTRQSEALALSQLLAGQGIEFVDAPVSGGVIGAEAGTLAIMVGASLSGFERIKPVLAALGNPTLVGGPGAGQLAKLCNQLIVGGTLNLIAEALLLAQAGGADPAAVRQALLGGFAGSKILELHGQRMLERNFMPGGQVKSQCKDMENILAAAQDSELNLPQAALITEVYRRLLRTHPHADHSAALLDLEDNNHPFRLGSGRDQLPENH
ncbi:3-hydroxyisobutyrate dehydrogenase-like beta-hydroxyacid dehydrogenase [Oxalobacteraceae bacterium GrIS 2.11]